MPLVVGSEKLLARAGFPTGRMDQLLSLRSGEQVIRRPRGHGTLLIPNKFLQKSAVWWTCAMPGRDVTK